MFTKKPSVPKILVISLILLASLVLNACGSQQTTISTSAPPTPTQVPPTMVPPSPTSDPATSTPEPPVLVTSMDEVLGEWLSRCGGGPCTIKISADEKYSISYVNPTEGQGVTLVERGKITFSDGIFHLETTSGFCETMPNGFYQAFLKHIDGELYLEMQGTQDDECGDRQSMISRDMKNYTK